MDRENYSPWKERIENKVIRIEEKVDEALYILKYIKQVGVQTHEPERKSIKKSN